MSFIDPLKPLPLISFETIVKEPLPPIDWLVEPLIATGDRLVLYGEFGSMKSWLLLNLALHLAAGRPWLGKFPILESRRVLYVDEEMNERTLRRRIKRLAMGAGLEHEELPFKFLSRVGVRFTDSGAKDLLSAFEKSQFDPEVVIVESLRRVLLGSENEAKDMSAFWRNVEPILKAGKTLTISHHMRKPSMQGGNASRNRASGSTDILAGADTTFAIQRLTTDSVVVEGIKSREAEEASPFVVSLHDEGEGSPVDMRYEGAQAEVQREGGRLTGATVKLRSFLDSLPSRRAKTGEIIEHLETCGFTTRTAERALKTMANCGALSQPEHGVWKLEG